MSRSKLKLGARLCEHRHRRSSRRLDLQYLESSVSSLKQHQNLLLLLLLLLQISMPIFSLVPVPMMAPVTLETHAFFIVIPVLLTWKTIAVTRAKLKIPAAAAVGVRAL